LDLPLGEVLHGIVEVGGCRHSRRRLSPVFILQSEKIV
jgi:hypothetical protein